MGNRVTKLSLQETHKTIISVLYLRDNELVINGKIDTILTILIINTWKHSLI